MNRTVVDLFAGIGGLSDGFRQAGCRVLGGIEWDPDLAHLYELNHKRANPEVKVLRKDIRLVEGQDLLTEFGIEAEELTYLVGGSPCQGYSTIGKRRPGDERNELIFEFPRLLSVVKPTAFLFENVPGLLELDSGDFLDRLLDKLTAVGYAARFQLVDAAACGVPQRRKRVIIYGTRKADLPWLDQLESPRENGPTVWDAIRDLPNPQERSQRYEAGASVPYGRRKPSAYGRKLRGKKSSVTHWEPVAHSEKIALAYALLDQGHTDPETKCWRLVAEGYARTLRAGSRTRTACRPVHPFEARVITVREAARIHSFRDSFVLPKQKSSAHAAIGNAVPPLMAKAVGDAFNRALTRNGSHSKNPRNNGEGAA